ELEPRQRAEAVGGGKTKVRSEAPFRGCSVEHIARKRPHRRQRAQIGRDVGIAVERIGYDDLAGIETRNFRRKAGTVAFGKPELAGRYVDPGEREPALVGAGAAGAGDGEKVVVAPRIKQRVLGQRSRRDQASHVAAYHALG